MAHSADENAVRLDDHFQLWEWLIHAGQSLTSLMFGVRDPPRGFSRMVLPSLESECSSLRCLSISAVASNPFAMRILRAVRGKLRKLEARGAHVPSIEKNCDGLRELHLVGDPTDCNFLKKVGETLQVLHITKCLKQNPPVLRTAGAADASLLSQGFRHFGPDEPRPALGVCRVAFQIWLAAAVSERWAKPRF